MSLISVALSPSKSLKTQIPDQLLQIFRFKTISEDFPQKVMNEIPDFTSCLDIKHYSQEAHIAPPRKRRKLNEKHDLGVPVGSPDWKPVENFKLLKVYMKYNGETKKYTKHFQSKFVPFLDNHLYSLIHKEILKILHNNNELENLGLNEKAKELLPSISKKNIIKFGLKYLKGLAKIFSHIFQRKITNKSLYTTDDYVSIVHILGKAIKQIKNASEGLEDHEKTIQDSKFSDLVDKYANKITKSDIQKFMSAIAHRADLTEEVQKCLPNDSDTQNS